MLREWRWYSGYTSPVRSGGFSLTTIRGWFAGLSLKTKYGQFGGSGFKTTSGWVLGLSLKT